VGAVLLVGVLAIQGPKTLKMLKGPQPVTSAAATTTTPAPAAPGAAPTPAVTDATGVSGAAAAPQPETLDVASLADSDLAPEAEDGQLLSFERFASKDPFAQQAQPVPARPAAEAKADETSAPAPAKPGAAASGTSAGGFTTDGATPAPAPVERATATSIAVNGVAEDVEVDAEFPAAQPTFVLVSLARDGKSVELGIAGGSYADGKQTLKLPLRKKVTLQNTADGSRYELQLLVVEGFPLPGSDP
jgi:hypothetical protein